MRALGVDLGSVRVGLAISDPGGMVATPLETLEAGDAEADDWADTLAGRLAAIASGKSCETVVVGLPRAMSGRDTASTRRARDLAAALERRGIDVGLWDERLSSVEAERVLIATQTRRAQRRASRDRVAATIILQGWLDARKR